MSTKGFKYCPVCGAPLAADFSFCPECGFGFETEGDIDIQGIILTNIEIIGKKYRCPKDKALSIFNGFIESEKDCGRNWYLLDAGGKHVDVESWVEHNQLISDTISNLSIEPGPDFSVFIVGGDDVVPIPGIDDPYQYGEGVIPSDMCYSFEGTYLEDFINGEFGNIASDQARNNVSRLPLEEGLMPAPIETDLEKYFNLCKEYPDGIPVNNVVMNSFADWIPASSTMTQHLPLSSCNEDPEMICNGMYVSPKLLVSDKSTMDIYKKSLKGAGMLMFNLHGSDDPEYSGFYSIDEAFSPSCLKYTNAKVFNTVACYGARYTGYERNDSMLLSAIYKSNLLLYTGSLVSVPMFYNYAGDEARELLLNPGTGSEVFMRLYSLYQFKGIPAGKALLQAKCDYFNMCRNIESDAFSMSTILMFSLYGNPLLYVQERSDVIESALNNDAMPPRPVKCSRNTFAKTTCLKLVTKNNHSLLGEVRSAVDENLFVIRKRIEHELYEKLGLHPDMLSEIGSLETKLSKKSIDSGYTFGYHIPNMRFSSNIHVEVSRTGKITKIFTTK